MKLKKRRKLKPRTKQNPDFGKSGYVVVTVKIILRWVVLVGLIIGLFYIWSSDLLRINRVTCVDSNNLICNEVVMAELNRYKGEHTFLVETVEIANKIENANATYDNVRIEARLPDELIAFIDQKIAQVSLQVATQSAALVVDEKMIVIERRDSLVQGSDRIITRSAGSLTIGDQVSDKPTIWAVSLLTELKEQFVPFSLIRVIDYSTVVVELRDGRETWFLVGKDVVRQVTSLQLILSKATIQPLPSIIDLRFEEPVLRS